MSTSELYERRLERYVTAMRNGTPDRVPIRPFVAEYTARHAGYTCQEVTHDYRKAFDAVLCCAREYDWDAVVGNMVYVWTGLTQAVGLNYYGVPGLDLDVDTGFQYREPAPEDAFMRADEYDHLIEDPTGYLYNVWLPRVADDVDPPGTGTSYRNNLSFVRGGMAMLSYFNALAEQNERLIREAGTVPAIAGILKAPFDILADKLRGYIGLTMDMFERPDRVLAACEALMPHLLHTALGGADPDQNLPVGFWMHRGCVPFIRPEQFTSHYWPTLRPIIEDLWAHGHQTLFYAEGSWDHHLDYFRELPAGSIVYHVDRGNLEHVHEVLGDRFCLSGGLPNDLLAFGSPDAIRRECRRIIDTAGRDGGYIMDASAIVQNDARPENIRAMTECTREYGVYGSGSTTASREGPKNSGPAGEQERGEGRPRRSHHAQQKAGICIPWSEQKKGLPPIRGDEDLLRSIWEEVEGLAHMYIWQLLVSF